MANLPHSFVFLAFWNILVDEKYSFEASSDHRRKGDDGSCGAHNPIPCQDIEEHLFGDISVGDVFFEFETLSFQDAGCKHFHQEATKRTPIFRLFVN
jgi:hypothetical protein